MKALKKLIIPTVLAFVATSATANASAIGRLENVSCDVVIKRGADMLKAVEGSGLLAGDRVISYDGSGANIVLNGGCSGSVGALQAVSLSGSNSCVAVRNVTPITDVERSFGQSSCGGALMAVPGIAGGTTGNMSLLAIAGGIAAVALAASVLGDEDDAPTSP